MSGSLSSKPPSPVEEAPELDALTEKFDPAVHDIVQGEGLLVPVSDEESADAANTEQTDKRALAQAYGEVVEITRECDRRCICPHAAERVARNLDSCTEEGRPVSVYEDANDGLVVGGDPNEDEAWEQLREEDGIEDPNVLIDPEEVAQSAKEDKDSIAPQPPAKDLEADAEETERQAIQKFIDKVSATGNELKTNVIFSVTGMRMSVAEMARIVDQVLRAEDDEAILAICETEDISLDYEETEGFNTN